MIVSKVINNNNIGQSLNSLNQKRVIDPFFGSVVSAGSSLIGGAINSIFGSASQRRENARNRAHQELMLQKQQEYNDKINAENREWTTESNVRRRIEDAGYNPYLYNGQASASAVNSNSAGSASPESAPATFDPSFGQALQNAGNSFAQSYNSIVSANQQDYALKTQKERDEYFNKLYGIKGGEQTALSDSQINLAKKQANLNASQEALNNIQKTALEQQALADDGTPMVKPNGQPMTVAEQRELGTNMQLSKTIDLIVSNAREAAANGDLRELEVQKAVFMKKMKAWGIEVGILESQWDELISNIKNINANASLAHARIGTERTSQRLNNVNADDIEATRPERKENIKADTHYKNVYAKDVEDTKPDRKENIKADTRNKKASAKGQEIHNYQEDKLKDWNVNNRKYQIGKGIVKDLWDASDAIPNRVYTNFKRGVDVLSTLSPLGALRTGFRPSGASAPTYSTPSLPPPRLAPRGYLPYKR